MRTLMLAGAAALAFATPAGLVAQDATSNAETTEAAEPAPVAAPVETADEANAEATPLPITEQVIPAAEPDEPDTVVTTHHGNLTPPPATALNKTYPLCTRTLQDNCRNPGEGDDTALGG